MSLRLPIRSATTHVLRGCAVVLVVIAAVAAGIGWLYALRHVAALRVGPRFADALPLQRLAGGAAQPLGRMVAAWLPAGLVAGLGIALVSGMHRAARSVAVFALALVFVLAAAAASDALTHNETIRSQIRAGASPCRRLGRGRADGARRAAGAGDAAAAPVARRPETAASRGA